VVKITEESLTAVVQTLKEIQKSAQSEVGSSPEGDVKRAWSHILANINSARILVACAVKEMHYSGLTQSED